MDVMSSVRSKLPTLTAWAAQTPGDLGKNARAVAESLQSALAPDVDLARAAEILQAVKADIARNFPAFASVFKIEGTPSGPEIKEAIECIIVALREDAEVRAGYGTGYDDLAGLGSALGGVGAMLLVALTLAALAAAAGG